MDRRGRHRRHRATLREVIVGLHNPLGEELRFFSAPTLALGASILTTSTVAIGALSVERGLLFIIGMAAGVVFHAISNKTHPRNDVIDDDSGGPGEERVSLTDLSAESTQSDAPRDGSEAYNRELERDNEEKDESASTKPVFGSNGGARGNNRNSGPTNGRR